MAARQRTRFFKSNQWPLFLPAFSSFGNFDAMSVVTIISKILENRSDDVKRCVQICQQAMRQSYQVEPTSVSLLSNDAPLGVHSS